MKIKSILMLSALALSSLNIYAEDLGKYVKPNIGTAHCRWFFYTPPPLTISTGNPSLTA